MRFKLLVFSLLFLGILPCIMAQTADEIVAKYLEATGGAEKWRALKGIKSTAVIIDHEMEIPYTRVALKDGRQILKFDLNGKEVVQQAFDGTVGWNTNFISMEAEKSEGEIIENLRREMKNFPHPLVHTKAQAYRLEYIGSETVEQLKLLKVKVTLNPKLVDGNEVENVRIYFFDAKTYLIIAMESEITSGNMKGKFKKITYNDYRNVDGLKFPYVQINSVDDKNSGTINFTLIELNPQVDDEVFKFPKD